MEAGKGGDNSTTVPALSKAWRKITLVAIWQIQSDEKNQHAWYFKFSGKQNNLVYLIK